MLFCITAGKPGGCFGITSRVKNKWEVAKRGMCVVIKLQGIQLEYAHWMMNVSSLLYRPHCIWWNLRVSRCWMVLDLPLLTCLPLLSSTSFASESSTGSSIWAVGSSCCTTGCVFTGKILRRVMQEQIPWSIFHMIKNCAVSGLISGWANPLRLFWGSGCFITPTPSCRDKGICDKQKYQQARDQKALCGGWPGVVGRK